MKSDVILINTARGGIINEKDLLEALNDGRLGGVSLDVFESEPYSGKLTEINRCLLTPHIGTMTSDCRSLMELQAVEEAISFCQGKSLEREVSLSMR
jgi:D-3-phosphoglycerate dehydrogenase